MAGDAPDLDALLVAESAEVLRCFLRIDYLAFARKQLKNNRGTGGDTCLLLQKHYRFCGLIKKGRGS